MCNGGRASDKGFSWVELKGRLAAIRQQKSYYIGGTLCIDFDANLCVGLNLDGHGFAINNGKELALKLPRKLALKVREIYREVKGREPFKEIR